MNNPVELIQKVLLKEIELREGKSLFVIWYKKQKDDQSIRSKTSCIYRLMRSLSDIEGGTGRASWYDMAGHLRQVILMNNYRFQLHGDYVSPLMNIINRFGLSIDAMNEVNAKDIYPSWLKYSDKLKAVYQLVKRRNNEPKIGDGLLYQMTRFSHYTSKEQKVLVQACLSMKEGETLLACLPTGGGKSLIGQLPAYLETRGGTIHGGVSMGGTTIIVVPTVALAFDQVQAARENFTNAISEEHLPQAYVGGISDDKKNIIYEGLRNGTLPLLFTSPEALLNNSFLHRVILKSASQDKVNRLVIDEAHIVVDWGGAFRTDFQLLSVFRKKLLKASNGKLKTVLLSATLTDSASETLRKLFSEEGSFIGIRSDALRSEPIYFIDHPRDEELRKERILEVIHLLPKPVILYVTKRVDALEWESLIKKEGYASVKHFSGDTDSEEREKIINRWNDNQIDIIVATSAFGMGVDKQDIRTVIHCCLPESTNRFYQEVGRGGRDGFASISLLSVIQEDIEDASSLTKSNVLTEGNMAERWEKLRTQPIEKVNGDTFWINTDVRPKHLKDDETGQRNANWNETAILFLYRCDLINILDIRKEESDKRRLLKIKMLDIEKLESKERLIAKLEMPRKLERERLNYDFLQMKNLVKSAHNTCLSIIFKETYPFANDACGGCPHCHLNNITPYTLDTKTETESQQIQGTYRMMDRTIGQYLGHYQELFLYLNKKNDVNNIEKVFTVVCELILSGIKTIVIPSYYKENVTELISRLFSDTSNFYFIFLDTEFLEDRTRYVNLSPLAILYPTDDDMIEIIYEGIRDYLNENRNHQVIHITTRDLYIFNERKKLIEVVDGNILSSERLFSVNELEEEFI